jgi:cholesterol oxidase
MFSLVRPHGQRAPHYDALVIGSGYGAGVAASRLSRMGFSTCVLERGREIAPGGFPKSLSQAAGAFQADLPWRRIGSRAGLFDLRVNADISVMVGCGLGGTSLINGNVMLNPETRVFDDPLWPQGLRQDVGSVLAEAYRRARRMLQPTPYPDTAPALHKLDAFAHQASAVGGAVTRPPINVTFEADPAGNHAGVVQADCTGCGDCCSGCNVGAKNTVAMNYLPDAANHGAHLFELCAVRHIEPAGDTWRVVFETLDDATGEAHPGSQSATADLVVLGAGTLGSTEILLRSQTNGLSVSDRLGRNFSGNGDVIAFGYNNDLPVNGVGIGHPPRPGADPVGPVIAGLIDLRGTDDLSDAMVIQEGAIPSVLAPLLPAVMSSIGPMFGTDTDIGDYFDEAKRSWKSLIAGAYTGAVHNTQTFLVMAHDGGGGEMLLEGDRLRLRWPDAGSRPVFEKISATLHAATAATGGTYVDNPMWSPAFGRNLVSVHPLGGCAMGEDAGSGVVDHKCQVFAADGTTHAGLYVCDGAALPRSLGVNPGLTISAVAERAMMLLAADHDRSFDDARKAGAPLRQV